MEAYVILYIYFCHKVINQQSFIFKLLQLIHIYALIFSLKNNAISLYNDAQSKNKLHRAAVYCYSRPIANLIQAGNRLN